MGWFSHTCRLPAPRRRPFVWSCRCGQEWRITPCVERETRWGSTVIATGTPTGGKGVRR